MLYFFAAYRAVRRALERDQRLSPCRRVPLWRLLAEEIALLARRVGRWRVTAVGLVVGACVLAVEVALSEATPGPAIAVPWRWLVAAVASLVAVGTWAAVHALRSSRYQDAGSAASHNEVAQGR